MAWQTHSRTPGTKGKRGTERSTHAAKKHHLTPRIISFYFWSVGLCAFVLAYQAACSYTLPIRIHTMLHQAHTTRGSARAGRLPFSKGTNARRTVVKPCQAVDPARRDVLLTGEACCSVCGCRIQPYAGLIAPSACHLTSIQSQSLLPTTRIGNARRAGISTDLCTICGGQGGEISGGRQSVQL